MDIKAYYIIGITIVIISFSIYLIRRNNIKNMNRIMSTPKVTVDDPIKLCEDLPKWAIKDKKPSKFFNGNRSFIQVALISKIVGTRTFWGEWDGVGLIRTDKRAYEVPKENVYGDIFIWDVDKKQSINELLSVGEHDAEDSFHELQVANMYYSIGRIAGANELDKKIGMIFILSIVTLLAVMGLAALIYFKTKDISGAIEVLKSQSQPIMQNMQPVK